MSDTAPFIIVEPHEENLGTVRLFVKTWSVYLPHQCDDWTVVSSNNPDEALDELDRFINAAQRTRGELARRIEGVNV